MFENTDCERCGRKLGYLPEMEPQCCAARRTKLDCPGGTRSLLSVLRELGMAWVQLDGAGRQLGAVLRGVPPQRHYSRHFGPGESSSMAENRGVEAAPRL